MDFEYFIIVLSGVILTVQTQLIFELSEKCVGGEQKYWDPSNGADEDSVPTYGVSGVGYYNWYAATAGNGSASMTGGTTTDSVCPYGWRLPTGGLASSTISWAHALDGRYTYEEILRSPLNFALYGEMGSNGNVRNKDEEGIYQTATANSTSQSRMLFLDLASVSTVINSTKTHQISIRCFMRNL